MVTGSHLVEIEDRYKAKLEESVIEQRAYFKEAIFTVASNTKDELLKLSRELTSSIGNAFSILSGQILYLRQQIIELAFLTIATIARLAADRHSKRLEIERANVEDSVKKCYYLINIINSVLFKMNNIKQHLNK